MFCTYQWPSSLTKLGCVPSTLLIFLYPFQHEPADLALALSVIEDQ